MELFRQVLYVEDYQVPSARGRSFAANVATMFGVGLRFVRKDHPAVVGRAADVGGRDLVIKVAARRGTPWLDWLAPVDRHLLRRCPAPVWLLHPSGPPHLDAVLTAVDVSAGASAALNRGLVRVGRALATRAGARLDIVHAWAVAGEGLMATCALGPGRDSAARVLAEARRGRRRDLELLLAQEGVADDAGVWLVKDRPVRGIQRVARRLEAGVVVVGHGGRSGLEAMLLGNVGERLAGRLPASLLVLKETAIPTVAALPAGRDRTEQGEVEGPARPNPRVGA